MKYFIGIDGGGTKSRLLAVDENGNKIGSAYGNSTNLASNSKTFVHDSLRRLIDCFLMNSNVKIADCIGFCIGSAGLDSENACLIMEQMIQNFGFSCRIITVNDSLLVLAAATKGRPGVVVVSGTGSIAYGMDTNGEALRCGGWGHVLDDGGSGYWIGKEALRSALRSFDGRGEKTVLEDMFREEFHITHLPDLIEKIYGEFNKAEIAGYAIYVKEGVKQNDKVCMDIMKEAARELYLLADAVIKRMREEEPNVIVSGGTILNHDVLYSGFRMHMKKNYPSINVVKIDKEPVMGAIYLLISQKYGSESKERI